MDENRNNLSFDDAYENITRTPALPYMVQFGIKTGINQVFRFSYLYAFKRKESFHRRHKRIKNIAF